MELNHLTKEIIENSTTHHFLCIPEEVPSAVITNDEKFVDYHIKDKFFEYFAEGNIPENQRKNDIVFKNVASALVLEGLTDEQIEVLIKPILEEHYPDKNYSEFYGWVQKGRNGFNNYNIFELNQWSKTYGHPEFYSEISNVDSVQNMINVQEQHNQEIDDIIDEKENYLKVSDLKYETRHLPHYNLIENVIPLYGKEYKLMKKSAYYLLVSQAVPISLKTIRIGQVESDLRVHPCFIMPSGSGKLTIKNGIIKIVKEFNPNANIKEPTTYHKEQLVGKVIIRKENRETNYYKKYGFIFADLFILEEGHELLTSTDKNDVDARDILTKGLDIYLQNIIQKQNLDNLDTPEETIKGYPHGNCLIFVQPLKFNERLTTKGLHRRLDVKYDVFPSRTRLDNFVQRLYQPFNDSQSAVQFAEFMKKINNLSGTWTMNEDVFKEFILCHFNLIEQGYLKEGKSAVFTRMIEYHLQNKLLKFSALNAISNLRTNITVNDVHCAFMDIMESFVHEQKFVETKIEGNINYDVSYEMTKEKKEQILQWMQEQGAINEENAITPASVRKKIIEIYRKSDSTARQIYIGLKRAGKIIENHRFGNYACWLADPIVNANHDSHECNDCNDSHDSEVPIVYDRNIVHPRKTYLNIDKRLENIYLSNDSLERTDENPISTIPNVETTNSDVSWTHGTHGSHGTHDSLDDVKDANSEEITLSPEESRVETTSLVTEEVSNGES